MNPEKRIQGNQFDYTSEGKFRVLKQFEKYLIDKYNSLRHNYIEYNIYKKLNDERRYLNNYPIEELGKHVTDRLIKYKKGENSSWESIEKKINDINTVIPRSIVRSGIGVSKDLYNITPNRLEESLLDLSLYSNIKLLEEYEKLNIELRKNEQRQKENEEGRERLRKDIKELDEKIQSIKQIYEEYRKRLDEILNIMGLLKFESENSISNSTRYKEILNDIYKLKKEYLNITSTSEYNDYPIMLYDKNQNIEKIMQYNDRAEELSEKNKFLKKYIETFNNKIMEKKISIPIKESNPIINNNEAMTEIILNEDNNYDNTNKKRKRNLGKSSKWWKSSETKGKKYILKILKLMKINSNKKTNPYTKKKILKILRIMTKNLNHK